MFRAWPVSYTHLVTLYDQSENPAIYSFDYNMSNDLPDPLTTSIDHWGFWNGGYENIDNVDTFLNDGHFEERKAVNTNVASCTMLQRITYPTKGEEAIDYEYNRFRYYQTKRTDSFAWDSNTAAYDTPLSGCLLYTSCFICALACVRPFTLNTDSR